MFNVFFFYPEIFEESRPYKQHTVMGIPTFLWQEHVEGIIGISELRLYHVTSGAMQFVDCT